MLLSSATNRASPSPAAAGDVVVLCLFASFTAVCVLLYVEAKSERFPPRVYG